MNIQTFINLWHKVGKSLRDEMYDPHYDLINSLTMIDLSILQSISENPDIIFKDLSDSLNIPKSTLTSAIKRLEKQAYVSRTQSKEDGRQFHLNLTDKGIRAQKQHLLTEKVVFEKLLSSLTKEEQQDFIAIFDKAVIKGEF